MDYTEHYNRDKRGQLPGDLHPSGYRERRSSPRMAQWLGESEGVFILSSVKGFVQCNPIL